ncbi:hypothetical protein K5E_16160 [Enterococcus thailandicus]|uniref:Uncharacterized protein n=1 Tax=bioreactor metagenome TaxID=1076179 RepID=A0A645CBX9_9ZZZZ|nr:putative holin-like toxin [Enterococcus thailandicus]MDK4352923.1 putative holin-like toxin [Enterococcus thailandicus]GMC03361.1 hypothetical protein K4E_08830 [Enterococcus thailandicus]GMC09477.1 hypothetical protein K5E_16160 [Enterococcus thailandicus]
MNGCAIKNIQDYFKVKFFSDEHGILTNDSRVYDGGYPIKSEGGCVCAYFQNPERGEAFLPVESALELMIGFGSLIATIIFGILAVVNQDKKK